MAKRPPGKGTKKRGRRPSPGCKAIVLCDYAIIEAGSGKVSLVGIFNQFTFATYPAPVPSFWLYVELLQGVRRYNLEVEIRDLTNDAVIARAKGIVAEFKDRMSRAQIMLRVREFVLQHPGIYEIAIIAEGVEIERQQFAAGIPPVPPSGGTT
jgi:uncharacterized protein DUF6941